MTRRDFVSGVLMTGGLSPLLASTPLEAVQGRAAAPPARILLFDTFGTVVDWRRSVAAEGERLGRAKGVTNVDWAAFADAWRAGYGPSMNRVRRGELPWTKLDVLHRMVLDELLVTFKIDGLSEAEKVDFNRVWHRLDPWPDAVEGLTRLKARFIIAPLSNGNLSLLTEMGKRAGLPWDTILSAETFGVYKPDPKLYKGAAHVCDVQPHQVLMVAAHQDDLDAARGCGLQTAYIERPREFGPNTPNPDRPDPANTHRASSLIDLATQLGC